MDVKTIVELISQGGLIPVLILLLFAGHKKWIVPGWYVKEILNDRNEWKEAALHGTRIASRAVDLAAAGKDSNGTPAS